MRSKEALKAALAEGIAAAATGTPLKDVYLYGTARGSVEIENYTKVIRIDVQDGTLIRTLDETRREQSVVFKIQCFVLPAEAGDFDSEEDASDASFDLAEAVFDYLYDDPTLGGEVTDIDFPEDETNFEKGMANFAGRRWGATNLYGIINSY